MRGTIHPRSSAAHKLACLSLYRALLKQSLRFHDENTSNTLLTLVRHRFHCDQWINSPHVICDALKKGRRAHALLREAVGGSPTALAQLTSTLDQVAKHASQTAHLRAHQNSLRGPTSPSKRLMIAHFEGQRSKYWAEKIPNPIPVFDRPVPREQLPNPEKPRRVPTLTNTQGIPFLRYKAGAQSPHLSRILRDLYLHDFKRWEANARLLEEVDHARLEDAWDRTVQSQTGYADAPDVLHDDGTWETKGWAEDTKTVLKELQQGLKMTGTRRTETTQRMWNIVQKETQLAEQEKAERKAARLAEHEQEQQQRLEVVSHGLG